MSRESINNIRFICFTAIPGSLWESFAESIGADKNNRLLLCNDVDPISIEFYIGDVKLVYASKDFIDPYFLVCKGLRSK